MIRKEVGNEGMSEEGQKTKEILQRLSEVLDVLTKISEDLQDIAKSLKGVKPLATPQVERGLGSVTPSFTGGKQVEDIRMLFTQELEMMLVFEDKGDFIKVTPRQYLGSDNFGKIAAIIRSAGGEYKSAGRDSHFRIPK